MKRDAFKLLNSMEHSWWYRGRTRVVRAGLARAHVSRVEDVLDFGAGFGGMHDMLAGIGAHVDAYEPDPEATKSVDKRGYRSVFSSEADAFARPYDLIGLFDVVEHIADDHVFLKEARGALRAGGRLAITVPAFPFLWSAHDVNHHHFRRYTKKSMCETLRQAGFTIEYASYWNMTLFIAAATLRLIGKSGESGLSMPYFLDAMFLMIIRVESFLMRFVPLPFGTGLMVIARRNKDSLTQTASE